MWSTLKPRSEWQTRRRHSGKVACPTRGIWTAMSGATSSLLKYNKSIVSAAACGESLIPPEARI